jgi:hypothetical protein
MILYTNFMPARFGGYTFGPITLIRPKHKDDVSLHAHEAVHRKQFRRNPLFGLAYFFSKQARLGYEVEAYKAQLAVNPAQLDDCARWLSTNYNLGISIADAKTLLTA